MSERTEYNRQYYLKHRDHLIQASKAWRAAHKDHYTNRIKELHRFYKQKAFEKLGGKCCKCGFSDWRALQVDHIQGGGSKARRTKGLHNRQGYTFYRKVFEAEDGQFQLLCANCNWIKAYENNERPGSAFPIVQKQEDVN